MNFEPKGFNAFVSQLSDISFPGVFDKSLAEQIRLQARVHSGGIIFVSGISNTIYAPWVMDGMSMSTRLLVHIDPDNAPSLDVQTLNRIFDHDIRVAAHIQDSASFVQDLSKYQFDLIVIATTNVLTSAPALKERLSENGTIIIVEGGSSDYSSFCDEYFVAPAGENHNACMMCRLSDHKNTTRKGGRRGRNNRSGRR